MTVPRPAQPRVAWRAGVSVAVLAATLLLGAAAAHYAAGTAALDERNQFQVRTREIEERIEKRMEAYLALLRATRGLFVASEEVREDEFRAFIAALELDRRYPGIQGIGYVRRVEEAGPVDGPRAARRPAGDAGERLPLVYLEPSDERNRVLLGFDLAGDAAMRAALVRAAQASDAGATARIALGDEVDAERSQAEFALVAPVFDNRRTAPAGRVAGWVLCAFQTGELFDGIFGTAPVPGVAFEISTSAGDDRWTRLYRSHRDVVPGFEPRYTSATTLGFGGDAWRVRFSSRPELETGAAARRAATVFLGSLAIGLLLFLQVRSLARARAKAERTAAELRCSEERLRLQMERMPIGCMLADESGRFTYWNPAAERIFGWTMAEARGHTPEERMGGGEDGAPLPRPGPAAGDGGTGGAAIALRTRSGRRITCEWHAAPLHDARGRLDGMLFMAQDVTARVELEGQFRHAQKMEAVGRLAGGVAHEFNNLLTAITGYAELLERMGRSPEDRRRFAGEIRRAGDRAAGLTRQLLAFSRRQTLEPTLLDVNAVLRDLGSVMSRIMGPEVRVTADLGAEVGAVLADRPQLEQVILNLCVNARDAMPEGGRLHVATRRVPPDADGGAGCAPGPTGERIRIDVTDTGEGMDEETRSRAFEPFFTTRPVGHGTGLGLSTVYGIVIQSGGAVDIDSTPGRGSRISIWLPAHELPAAIVPAPALAAAPAARTVLVVEDEEAVRTLMAELLALEGHRLLEAGNGAEALELVERHAGTIDLLLTDVVMPVMGGRELWERLHRERPELRVLFVSGYTREELDWADVSAPGAGFLAKPFSAQALLGKVRSLLDTPRVREGAA